MNSEFCTFRSLERQVLVPVAVGVRWLFAPPPHPELYKHTLGLGAQVPRGEGEGAGPLQTDQGRAVQAAEGV